MNICVDCAMLHANGDLTGIDNPEREAEVLAGLTNYPFLAVGDHEGFSWSGCDACGSKLGGDRFSAEVI